MAVTCPENGIAPNPNAILWRYMELDRFQSMLERKALFFCRAGKFSDPFEGSLPKKEYENRIKSQRQADAFYGNYSTDEQIAENIAGLTNWHLQFRDTHTVNCWHINYNESDAMWQLYLKSNEGVAIQTTVAHLMLSLQSTSLDIDISRVRYIDYDRDVFFHHQDFPHQSYNLFAPLIHKRNEFMHERELRLIHEVRDAENDSSYWEKQEFESGKLIEVDLDILVDKIILPPTSDEKFRGKVETITKEFGHDFVFEKSALSKPALF